VAGISTDITDRKTAEAAVRQAKEEAERANRAKSDFLSRMSHELRTPLNSILGFGQLLQLESLPVSAGDSVDRIVNAGRHLLALINEVLEISRIEAGGQPLLVEPVHCCGPLTEAVDLVRPLAAERDIALEQDLHAGLFEFVLADYQRLKQVVLNVLTNAVKYNRVGGSVRITLQVMPGRLLRYRFADTGRGIAADDLERAFLPFERLDADSTDAEGTGLGLALSRGLIEAMGGAIGVESSAKGVGSTFYVDLPITDNPHEGAAFLFQPETAAFPKRIERGGRVLYIEDNLANYALVQRVFERLGGLELMSAMQGQMGIELAAQHAPDLILLDLHLPDIDGEEVLRRLRSDERMRDIPVIILSADATVMQRDRLKAAGAEDYLTKPLELAGFVEAVERALGRAAD
jgi:CheY-like chemotaxis protein